MELRDILRDLYGVDRPQGCTEEEIAAVRKRFGAIPAAVEDFWRTFGRTQALNHGADNWIFPQDHLASTCSWDDEGLILLNEHQGVCLACARREDLRLPDPPVYTWMNPDGPWLLSAAAVSSFLEAALTYEAVWQLECGPKEYFELSSEDFAAVQAGLEKRSAVLRNWMDLEITFYSNRPDNLAVVMDMGGEYQTVYGGSSKESYIALLEVMEGLGEPI